MPTFEDLAFHASYPVLHTQRNDGVAVVATRVPLADVRLQQWGWLLTPAYTKEQSSLNGLECLLDNNGRRYPKVHMYTDVQKYIEQWGCQNWEVGYSAVGKVSINRVTMPLEDKVVQEDALNEAIEDLRLFQGKQTATVCSTINQQRQSFQQDAEILVNRVIGVMDTRHQETLSLHTYTRKNLEELVKNISDVLDNIKATNTSIPNFFQESFENWNEDAKNSNRDQEQILVSFLSQSKEAEENLKKLEGRICDNYEELKQNIAQKLSENMISLCQGIQEDSKQRFDGFNRDVKSQFDVLFDQIDTLQKQEKKILEAVYLEEDDKSEKTALEDVGATIAKSLQKAKDPIERMMTRQMQIIYGYYKDINSQAKDGLKTTHNIMYIGVSCIVISVICVIISIFLFNNVGAIIVSVVSAIGALISNVTMGVSKMNKTYELTAEQRAYFYRIIERLHRMLLAYEISQKMSDEAKKQENVNMIIEGLVKNGELVDQAIQLQQSQTNHKK